jgi:hypothetical protein
LKDLRFFTLLSHLPNKFVISTGAKRSGEICGFASSHTPSLAPEAVLRRVEFFDELQG